MKNEKKKKDYFEVTSFRDALLFHFQTYYQHESLEIHLLVSKVIMEGLQSISECDPIQHL